MALISSWLIEACAALSKMAEDKQKRLLGGTAQQPPTCRSHENETGAQSAPQPAPSRNV